MARCLLRCADPLGIADGPPAAVLRPPQAAALVAQADAHGVLPIVVRNFEALAENPAYAAARADALDRLRIARALNLMLAVHGDALARAATGLDLTLVKGMIFARRLYPDAALRLTGDIDVLCAPHAVAPFEAVLRAADFRFVEFGHDRSRREAKWVHRANPLVMVELHTDMVHAPSLQACLSLSYADIAEDCTSPAALLMIAVLHGALHNFERLRHVVDIRQAARALHGAKEENRFEALVAATGGRLAAAFGLDLAHRMFGEPRCPELATGLGSPRRLAIARRLVTGGIVLAAGGPGARLHVLAPKRLSRAAQI